MTAVLVWIVGAVAAVGGTVLLALPLRTWRQRGMAVCAFLLIVAGAFTLAPSMLSRPKPVELEWFARDAGQAAVIGSRAIEGRGIYVLLQIPGIGEPRYYVLPWSMKTAQALQDAQNALNQGDRLMMGIPFAWSWDPDEPPQFYTLPQPMLPPKAGEDEPEQSEGGGA